MPYAQGMQSRISVVIPMRNDAPAVRHAVTSVLNQQPDVVEEILIVVGPSSDGSEAVAAELEAEIDRVRVLANPSGKTPQAMNLGVANSVGDVVVRVDARSSLPTDYVANAVESLEATGAGNVGAVQVPVGDEPTQRAIAAAMASLVGSGGVRYRRGTKLAQVDTAYLGVFRRDAFDAVGGFDPTFDRNQDAELNMRLNQSGYPVWLDPRLRVEYRPRASLRALASQYWQYGWWRQKTVRKNHSTALRQIVVPVMVVAIVASLIAALAGWPIALLVPAGYLGLLVVAAIAADGLSLRERVTMIGGLITMHFCWGTAFLVSIVR